MRRHASPLRAALAAGTVACACHAAADSAPPPILKPALSIDTALAAPPRLTDEDRAILCFDLKSLTRLTEETATLNDMAVRVRRMQATVAEVRALIEAMPSDHPGAQMRPAAVAPSVSAPPPVMPPPAVAVTPPPAAPQESPWMEIAAGGAVLALLGMLWARRRTAVPAPAAGAPLPSVGSVETTIDEPLPAAPPPARTGGRSPGIARAVRAGAAVPAAGPQSISPALPEVVPSFGQAAVAPAAASAAAGTGPQPAVELPEVDQALELAEVMVSMGLTQAAGETLVEHIRANPRRALYHWLRLLDIYKASGKKEDFEHAATELRRNFNIQAEDWLGGKAAQAHSIEDYGHLCARIQELWDRPGCIDYMARLLEDNRGGARLGFPQAVAEDILLLIAIQRDGGSAVGA